MYDDGKQLDETEALLAVGSTSIAVRNAPLPLVETVGDEASRDGAPETLRQHVVRLIRYSATSGIALGVSEATLLLLFATHTFDATIAAVIANLAGTVPSYFLSRYWIWADSDRRRVGRQVVLYWITSIIAMAITSLSTGAITSAAPAGQRAHVIVAGVGFLGVNLVLWVTKYVVYQKVIFKKPVTV